MKAFTKATSSSEKLGRILYVIGSLDSGGTERHLALITPALKKLGWEPHIFCLSHRGTHADDVERQGVVVIAPPFGGWRGSRPLRLLALTAACIKLLALIASRRPHLIHFFLPMAYILGAPLALLMRVPIRLMSRRSLNRYQSQYPLISVIESRLHRHMTQILGNSRKVIDELRMEGCRPDRLKLIYNGTDLSSYSPDLDADSPIRRSELILIIVANLIPYKGHTDLIHALSKVHVAMPVSWELWCVGRDDGLLDILQELAAAHGMSTNIKFLGSRTDIPSLLKAADIGILCSHEEGFANAIIEGMAAGLPMIVTDVGGNAEAVLHDQTGIVVCARDPEGLGKAILELASDSEKRNIMGKFGRQRAQEHFSLERCVQEYSDLYRELLQSRSNSNADDIKLQQKS